MSQEIVKPIIVIGLGRSGSSVFHQILARHEQLAWLSSVLEKNPKRPYLNSLVMQLLEAPLLGDWLARKMSPEECYGYWETLAPGFRTPFRDLREFDLTDRARRRIHASIGEAVTRRRNRLLVKITGWPRSGYLQACFPDAQFIYIRRNIESVANSLLSVGWWKGWQGPLNWRWGPLPVDCERVWKENDQSFVALAGIQCVILERAIDEALSRLDPAAVMDVDYDNFCSEPHVVFGSVLDHCGLPFSDRFKRHVDDFELKSTRSKWRSELTEDQQSILESVVAELRSPPE